MFQKALVLLVTNASLTVLLAPRRHAVAPTVSEDSVAMASKYVASLVLMGSSAHLTRYVSVHNNYHRPSDIRTIALGQSGAVCSGDAAARRRSARCPSQLRVELDQARRIARSHLLGERAVEPRTTSSGATTTRTGVVLPAMRSSRVCRQRRPSSAKS